MRQPLRRVAHLVGPRDDLRALQRRRLRQAFLQQLGVADDVPQRGAQIVRQAMGNLLQRCFGRRQLALLRGAGGDRRCMGLGTSSIGRTPAAPVGGIGHSASPHKGWVDRPKGWMPR